MIEQQLLNKFRLKYIYFSKEFEESSYLVIKLVTNPLLITNADFDISSSNFNFCDMYFITWIFNQTKKSTYVIINPTIGSSMLFDLE